MESININIGTLTAVGSSDLLGVISATLVIWFFAEFLTTLRDTKFTETSLVLSRMGYFCWHVKRLFRPSLDRFGGFDDDCLGCRFILFAHKNCGCGSNGDDCPPNDQADPQPGQRTQNEAEIAQTTDDAKTAPLTAVGSSALLDV